ncbi:MAG TPA: hypothetical protein PLL06_11595, partial [Acidobacteriota bacterium]|nr:hypothetical protein [Acidobacteriota bacterium]
LSLTFKSSQFSNTCFLIFHFSLPRLDREKIFQFAFSLTPATPLIQTTRARARAAGVVLFLRQCQCPQHVLCN